ncbi:MAG: M28 family peptidase [Planctomycetes bacterium]|nr:M28 family peptidase [Planctomycetota bacterium]
MLPVAFCIGLFIPQVAAPAPMAPSVSVAPSTPTPAHRLALERELAATVSEPALQARVRALVALGPRMGGTSSGARAAALREKLLRDAGLDVRVLEDGERWCHEETRFSVRARRLDDGTELALARAWPWGYSPSGAGKLALSLEPVDGGAWLGARFAAKKGSPTPKLALIDGATTLDGSHPVVHHLKSGDSNPTAVFGLSRDEGATLRAWLAAGAEVEIEWELVSVITKARARTVVARLPDASGAEPWKDDYLLFCAHGDSDAGGPGADDNASGEAVVIEIASAWAKAVRERKLPPPAHEVRFAIWGSEIASTREYLESRVPAEGGLLGVINYDQAGFGSGADQLNLEPDDLPANVELARVLLAVLADHKGENGFPERWATNKSLGGTDSYVFSGSKYCRENARPALTLFTSAWGEPGEHPRTPGMPGEAWRDRDHVSVDYDNFYHSAGDTPENTTDKEPWNMGWCARLGWLGAARYLEGLR